MTTAITPAGLSDAIALLHEEGLVAVLDAFPALRGQRDLLRDLAALEEDHEALDQLTARCAARIEETEAELRRAVLQEEVAA